jgi:hypothetical protein
MSHGRVHDEPSRNYSLLEIYNLRKEHESIDNNNSIMYHIYTSGFYICIIEV